MKIKVTKRKATKYIAVLMAAILFWPMPLKSMGEDCPAKLRVETEETTDFENGADAYLKSLTKSVSEAEKFRHYDVTLEVNPHNAQAEEYVNADVVLIVDRSASMKDKIDDRMRIEVVEELCRKLVNTILPDADTENRVAIVSFGQNVYNNKYTTNLHGFENKDILLESLSDKKIFGTPYDGKEEGSTNIQAGIMKAKEALGISDFVTWNYEEENGKGKIIILLTDGEPTDRYSDVWNEDITVTYDQPDWWNDGEEYTKTLTFNNILGEEKSTNVRIPDMGNFDEVISSYLADKTYRPSWWNNSDYLIIKGSYLNRYQSVYGTFPNYVESIKCKTLNYLDIDTENSSKFGSKRWSYLSDEEESIVSINGIPLKWSVRDDMPADYPSEGLPGGAFLTSPGNGSTEFGILEIVTEATRLEGQYTVAQGIDLYAIDYSNEGEVKELLQSMVKKMDNPPGSFGSKYENAAGTGSAAEVIDNSGYSRVYTAANATDIENMFSMIDTKTGKEIVQYEVTETLENGFEFVLDESGNLPQPDNGQVVIDTDSGNTFTWTFSIVGSSAPTYTFPIRVKDEETLLFPQGVGYGNNKDGISVSTTEIVYTPLDENEVVTPVTFNSPKSRVAPLVSGSVYVTDREANLIMAAIARDDFAYLGAKVQSGAGEYAYQWYKGKLADAEDEISAAIDGYAGCANLSPYTEEGNGENLHADVLYSVIPGEDAGTDGLAGYYIKIIDTKAVNDGYQYGTTVRYPLNISVDPIVEETTGTQPTSKPAETSRTGNNGGSGGVTPGTTKPSVVVSPSESSTVSTLDIVENSVPLRAVNDDGIKTLEDGVPKTGNADMYFTLVFSLVLSAVSLSAILIVKKRKIPM